MAGELELTTILQTMAIKHGLLGYMTSTGPIGRLSLSLSLTVCFLFPAATALIIYIYIHIQRLAGMGCQLSLSNCCLKCFPFNAYQQL